MSTAIAGMIIWVGSVVLFAFTRGLIIRIYRRRLHDRLAGLAMAAQIARDKWRNPHMPADMDYIAIIAYQQADYMMNERKRDRRKDHRETEMKLTK